MSHDIGSLHGWDLVCCLINGTGRMNLSVWSVFSSTELFQTGGMLCNVILAGSLRVLFVVVCSSIG